MGGSEKFTVSPAEESSINKVKSKISAKLIYFDKQSDLALLTMAFQNKADSDLVQDYTGFSNGLRFDPNEPRLLDTVYAFGCPAEFESSVTDFFNLRVSQC